MSAPALGASVEPLFRLDQPVVIVTPRPNRRAVGLTCRVVDINRWTDFSPTAQQIMTEVGAVGADGAMYQLESLPRCRYGCHDLLAIAEHRGLVIGDPSPPLCPENGNQAEPPSPTGALPVVIPASWSSLTLQDCAVCDGLGLMTAASVQHPERLHDEDLLERLQTDEDGELVLDEPHPVLCPGCNGRGSLVRPIVLLALVGERL